MARWLLLALCGALSAAASRGEEPALRLVRPPAGAALVGPTEIELELSGGAAPELLRLEVDGEVVREWRRPPYVARYDFGVDGRGRTLVATALLADGSMLRARRESPAIRIDELVDLELQQLYVTVEDRRGRRRLDLERADFLVEDGGRAQEIVTFTAGEVPFTATLLVDASDSMRGRRLASALEAARRFVTGMRDLDQAQLLAFSDRVLAATPAGSRHDLTSGAGRTIAPRGGTAIRDHLFLALSLLEERQGRRAAVLLSDGWDQLSVLSGEELRAAAERSQSTVYWVRLAGDEPTGFHRAERLLPSGDDFADLRFRYHPAPSSWADEASARNAYRRLERLVEMTGGRVLTAADAGGLERAMAEVLAELHQQYAVGYYPRPRGAPGQWRPVTVRLRSGGGLEVRSRKGYVER